MCGDDKKKDAYLISIQNFSNMLSSFVSDLIVSEVECGKCLCEMRRGEMYDDDDKKEADYLINFESFSNILSSMFSDLIVFETESSKCLCEMRRGGMCNDDRKKPIT